MWEALEPNRVFYWFEQICKIPHGSGNTDTISQFLVQFSKDNHLEYRQDKLGNVIIFKDASAGYEKKKPIILQGHMDMVAVKEKTCPLNLISDSLDLAIEGDYVFARQTSLGADDGIALAYALSILESESIAHPQLEVIFTVDEEVGMSGAAKIDLTDCRAETLINIDSEKEGEFTVACAGGLRVNADSRLKHCEVNGNRYKLTLSGLKGGHSGVEIDKGLANADRVFMQCLKEVYREVDIKLESAMGGTKDNAIPSYAEAFLWCHPTVEESLVHAIKNQENRIKEEYLMTEPEIKLKLEKTEGTYGEVLDEKDFNRILSMVTEAPNGVLVMSKELPGLVQTSLNLGILTISDQFHAVFSLRSSNAMEKEKLKDRLSELIRQNGGTVQITGEYPAWEYKKESELRDKMVEIYARMFHKEPTVLSIHAGLECGLFLEKIPELDCVSFGPDILDIHTTKEKLSISSTARMWAFLLEILKEI